MLLRAYLRWNNTIDMPTSHGSTWADVMGSQIPRLKTYCSMMPCQGHWPGVTLQTEFRKQASWNFDQPAHLPELVGRQREGTGNGCVHKFGTSQIVQQHNKMYRFQIHWLLRFLETVSSARCSDWVWFHWPLVEAYYALGVGSSLCFRHVEWIEVCYETVDSCG